MVAIAVFHFPICQEWVGEMTSFSNTERCFTFDARNSFRPYPMHEPSTLSTQLICTRSVRTWPAGSERHTKTARLTCTVLNALLQALFRVATGQSSRIEPRDPPEAQPVFLLQIKGRSTYVVPSAHDLGAKERIFQAQEGFSRLWICHRILRMPHSGDLARQRCRETRSYLAVVHATRRIH